MIDIKLDPCRYCGGEAIIEECEFCHKEERIVIKCRRCGITLDHTQYWYTKDYPDAYGNTISKRLVPQNLSTIEIWNGGLLNEKM